ncbi:unnamed protein product [Cyclocybe aegerita]|uniref:Uncharacterized protein n=1 Tax=Cyclocybe aegerita TaxID=1973307 RepID=A0A8S0WYL9_CYCAE|nr:unnamed protein product [Cyclocybe aegerita]
MFEMSETPSTSVSLRIPTIFDSDYLQPRYRNLWSAEERARFQMVIIELAPEATMWHEELVEVYALEGDDQEMKVEDLGDERAVAKEEEESGDEEVKEVVVSETQPESASRTGRKRRRSLGSPRRSKRKLVRTASGAKPAFIDIDGDDLPGIAVKSEELSNISQKQEDEDEDEEADEEDELDNEDDELVDPPDGLAEKVEEWVTALQILVKGKKRLRQQDLLNLKVYLEDIHVHRAHFKPASTLAQTIFAVSQLDANDVPYRDALSLRALAKKSVRGWGIRKLRAR